MLAPLTPAECDLQDFPFMPLHVARLRDSDLASEEEPEACWYAVLLWAASWHQIPAGSLPDSDAVLTKLIGLGRDVETFRRHRAGALRGFVKCDDGRLYHPIVAEQALAAWQSKLQQRWKTECARIKKQNQRNGTSLAAPTFEQFMSERTADPCPDNVPRDANECPQGKPIQGTGTGIFKINPPTPQTGGLSDDEFEAIWKAYPSIGRGTCARDLGREVVNREVVAGATAEMLLAGARFAAEHAAAGGKPKRFDRWVRDKLYLNAGDGKPSAAPTVAWAGPPDVLAVVADAMHDETRARTYLAGAVVSDGAIYQPRPSLARGLRQDAGQALGAHGYRIEASAPPQAEGVAA